MIIKRDKNKENMRVKKGKKTTKKFAYVVTILAIAVVALVALIVKYPQTGPAVLIKLTDSLKPKSDNKKSNLIIINQKEFDLTNSVQINDLGAPPIDGDVIYKNAMDAVNNINRIKESDNRLASDNPYADGHEKIYWWDVFGLYGKKIVKAKNNTLTIESRLNDQSIEMALTQNSSQKKLGMKFLDASWSPDTSKTYKQGDYLLYESDQSLAVTYQLNQQTLKESVVIGKKLNNNTLSFELTFDDGLTIDPQEDKSLQIVDNGGLIAWKIETPTIVDRDKQFGKIDLIMDKNNPRRVNYVIDSEFLSKASYPVVFDPTVVANPNTPSATKMVYDRANNRLIVVRADESGSVFNTYTYNTDLGQWKKMNTTNNPPYLVGTDMVYDDVRNKALLFGGYNPSTNSTTCDLWVYTPPTDEVSDGSWLKKSCQGDLAAPNRVAYHRLVWDSVASRAWVIGGWIDRVSPNTDPNTWNTQVHQISYSSSLGYIWTPSSQVSPRVADFAATWDRDSNQAVMYGGYILVEQ